MTIALWCVLAAALLPYLGTVMAKGGGTHFDNRLPRGWLAAQTGWRARANAAQLNSFEAFPLFAAAVLVASAAHAPQSQLDRLALLFIAARLAYLFAYVADFSLIRSVVWFVGFGSAVAIFVSAA